MGGNGSVPRSLQIVAVGFILVGIHAGIETVLSIGSNAVRLNLGVVGVFVGIGLFCLSPAARIVALVFVWLGFFLIPVQILVLLFRQGARLGLAMGYLPVQEFLAVLSVLAYLAFMFYAYVVLTRPRVKRLFQ